MSLCVVLDCIDADVMFHIDRLTQTLRAQIVHSHVSSTSHGQRADLHVASGTAIRIPFIVQPNGPSINSIRQVCGPLHGTRIVSSTEIQSFVELPWYRMFPSCVCVDRFKGREALFLSRLLETVEDRIAYVRADSEGCPIKHCDATCCDSERHVAVVTSTASQRLPSLTGVLLRIREHLGMMSQGWTSPCRSRVSFVVRRLILVVCQWIGVMIVVKTNEKTMHQSWTSQWGLNMTISSICVRRIDPRSWSKLRLPSLGTWRWQFRWWQHVLLTRAGHLARWRRWSSHFQHQLPPSPTNTRTNTVPFVTTHRHSHVSPLPGGFGVGCHGIDIGTPPCLQRTARLRTHIWIRSDPHSTLNNNQRAPCAAHITSSDITCHWYSFADPEYLRSTATVPIVPSLPASICGLVSKSFRCGTPWISVSALLVSIWSIPMKFSRAVSHPELPFNTERHSIWVRVAVQVNDCSCSARALLSISLQGQRFKISCSKCDAFSVTPSALQHLDTHTFTVSVCWFHLSCSGLPGIVSRTVMLEDFLVVFVVMNFLIGCGSGSIHHVSCSTWDFKSTSVIHQSTGSARFSGPVRRTRFCIVHLLSWTVPSATSSGRLRSLPFRWLPSRCCLRSRRRSHKSRYTMSRGIWGHCKDGLGESHSMGVVHNATSGCQLRQHAR